MATTKSKQTNVSTFRMGLFTTSKLIQNLGSRNEVYKFNGYFRSAHGRDQFIVMARGYWLINSNRSEVRRFTENKASEDHFNKYVFIDNGKIVGYLGKKEPLLQKREEFKLEEARQIWKKLISQGWRRTKLFD